MRVIIAGSRIIEDYDQVLKAVSRCGFQIDEVVSGTARGVDSLGERWAKEQGIPVTRFVPKWKAFGTSAGYMRNMEMAKYAHAVILIWDGQSAGSASMKRIARMLSMPLYELVVTYDGF